MIDSIDRDERGAGSIVPTAGSPETLATIFGARISVDDLNCLLSVVVDSLRAHLANFKQTTIHHPIAFGRLSEPKLRKQLERRLRSAVVAALYETERELLSDEIAVKNADYKRMLKALSESAKLLEMVVRLGGEPGAPVGRRLDPTTTDTYKIAIAVRHDDKLRARRAAHHERAGPKARVPHAERVREEILKEEAASGIHLSDAKLRALVRDGRKLSKR